MSMKGEGTHFLLFSRLWLELGICLGLWEETKTGEARFLMLQSAIVAWIPCLYTSFMWELSPVEAAFSGVSCCTQPSRTRGSLQGAGLWGSPCALAAFRAPCCGLMPRFFSDFLKSSFLTPGGTSWWRHVISFLVFMNSKGKSLSFPSRFLTFLFPGQFFFLMDQKKPRIHSYLFLNLFFNWKIIVLQNFVVFCQTPTWVSYRCTYVPSLLNLPPHPTSLSWYRAPVWVLWDIQQIPIGYLFYIW